jgi:hypothetical protein
VRDLGNQPSCGSPWVHFVRLSTNVPFVFRRMSGILSVLNTLGNPGYREGRSRCPEPRTNALLATRSPAPDQFHVELRNHRYPVKCQQILYVAFISFSLCPFVPLSGRRAQVEFNVANRFGVCHVTNTKMPALSLRSFVLLTVRHHLPSPSSPSFSPGIGQ